MWHYAERPRLGRSFLVLKPGRSQAAQCPPAVLAPFNHSAPLNFGQLKPKNATKAKQNRGRQIGGGKQQDSAVNWHDLCGQSLDAGRFACIWRSVLD